MISMQTTFNNTSQQKSRYSYAIGVGFGVGGSGVGGIGVGGYILHVYIS
jgi:hypothetical protein